MPHRLLFLLLLLIVVVDDVVCQDICQLCRCTSDADVANSNHTIVRCDSSSAAMNDNEEDEGDSSSIVLMDKIVWPEGRGAYITGHFDGIGLRTLQKLSSSKKVVYLSFENNNIDNTWPKTFSGLNNLQYLSLAFNHLTNVPPETFRGLQNLIELNMANNKVKELSSIDFQDLTNLKVLNLNNNKIASFPDHALETLDNLEYLYLSNNALYFINFDNNLRQSPLPKFKVLDVSFNKLTIVMKDTFQKALMLEDLNLSHNNIKNIEKNAFENCEKLTNLDLSYNELSEIENLPPSIEILNLCHNLFIKTPVLPENLIKLDISQNQLYDLYIEDVTFEKLQLLNVSNNQLQKFEAIKPSQHLSVLDVSYNSLEQIPSYINSQNMPSLEELYVDGNPLQDLHFSDTLALKLLSANNLKRINILKSINVKEKTENETSDMNCLTLSISNCERLSTIAAETFRDMSLCYLDISNNNFSQLPMQDNWSSIKYGVNLQGNPWNCECDLQWILDSLLEHLYKNHPRLLHELRCASPRQYKGLRLVHWYQHSQEVFCKGSRRGIQFENYMISESTQDKSESTDFALMVGLLVGIAVVTIIFLALLVYLITGSIKQKQYERQRQNRIDIKKTIALNGQNEPLNKQNDSIL